MNGREGCWRSLKSDLRYELARFVWQRKEERKSMGSTAQSYRNNCTGISGMGVNGTQAQTSKEPDFTPVLNQTVIIRLCLGGPWLGLARSSSRHAPTGEM